MVKNKQFFVCTLLALLILVLTGCTQSSSETINKIVSNEQSEKTNVVDQTSKNPKKSSTNTSSIQSNHKAPDIPLEAYKKVLINKVKFFSTDNKKYIDLNNFLNLHPDYRFKVTHFTVLDMDGDKIPEVVLELTHDDYPDYFEVLHYMNGTVYGYNIVYRGLEELKKDGTFLYSNGAADNGYGKLRFESNTCETDILGYSESSDNNGVFSISYFVNQKPVTEKSFKSFCKEQDQKEDPGWYKFLQNNIENELTFH